MDQYRHALRGRLQALVTQPPPPPWRRTGNVSVGGLSEVGWIAHEGRDLLLVVSSQGRGVLDAVSGQRLARDDDDDSARWFDAQALRSRAIGPWDGQEVAVAGLAGGGLPRTTSDGWLVEVVAPDWPDERVVLTPPGGTVLAERFADGCVQVHDDRVCELRAAGFSPTGRALVIASSCQVALFARQP